MYTTRQSLLDAMRQNQESAWEDFRTTYAPLVRLIAAKRHLNDQETDELLQDVCLNVFQRDALNKYDPAQGRFRTYLGRIIYNCANDIIRKRNAAADAAHFTTRSFNHLPQDNPDPTQLELQQDWENFLMEKAMAEVRARCADVTFLAFEFHARQKRPAKEVAAQLGISEQNVYLASSRITQRIKEAIERLRKEFEQP